MSRRRATLRAGNPPVIGRIVDGTVRIDMRGVQASEDEVLSAAILEALA